MKVHELVEFLKEQPQDMEVGYACCSEYCVLDSSDIGIDECCEPRNDGWIQRARPDKKKQTYVMFPGN